MSSRQRDLLASPLQRVIGVGGLAAAIFNITVGAAIFVLPAHVAGPLGAAAPLAYAVCAVATALVALCIAEAGSRVSGSGGPYAYVEVALGPYVGYLCAVMLWLGITLAMAAVSTVLADAVAGLLPVIAGAAARAALLILLFAALTVVNARGAALGSRLSGIATLAKLVPLLAFVVLGLPHVHVANITFAALPPLDRLGGSGLLLMFAFFGMESALQVGGEVVHPARTVPRAIGLALVSVGLLYIAVQVVAQGVLGGELAAPEAATAPLAVAAERFAGTAGARLILIGMLVSTFGFLAATMLATPRTLYALARDGYLPRALAVVHPMYRTPYTAIVVQGAIVCLVALTGTYVKLALVSDVAILLVYLVSCLGAWQLRRLDAGGEREEGAFRMPGGSVVPWLGAALIVGLLARASAGAWLLTGAMAGAATLGFLARARRAAIVKPPREEGRR